MVAPDTGSATVRTSFFAASRAHGRPSLGKANDDGANPLELALSAVPELQPVLDMLGVPSADLTGLAARAALQGTTFQAELLASGKVDEQAYFAAMAQAIGVEYTAAIEATRLLMDERACRAQLEPRNRVMSATLKGEPGRYAQVISPDERGWEMLKRYCSDSPNLRQWIRVAAPSVLRGALLERCRALLTQDATDHLHDTRPDLSARDVLWPWQAYDLGIATGMLPLAIATAPAPALFGLHLFVVSFFIACAALRATAAIWRPKAEPPDVSLRLSPDLPVYTVLVALYREAEVVPDLLVGLSLLQWPRSKLEVKLVCEQDDAETIAAVNVHPLRSYVEVVLVPPSLPRTKPKALAYALRLSRGELIVLYDAEDRPHPMQLAEAWQRFQASGGDLACVQAPLEIANRRENIIADMFGLEYAAQFRGLLPWLAHNRITLPLGGTSNHFRRDVLEEVGGWDPYNVTEDADLGLRLARHGYRCETLTCPTREQAPTDLGSWHSQRVRWFKGWILTWLVHMRRPAALAADLPLPSFVVTQILFAGMVLSALLHLLLWLLLAGLAVQLAFDVPMGLWQSRLVAVDLFSIALGYGAFLTLGWMTQRPGERRGFWKLCLFTPVYWTMLSLAAWCALFDLWRRPHHWAKTPHRRARSW